jgi:hypothetical protein
MIGQRQGVKCLRKITRHENEPGRPDILWACPAFLFEILIDKDNLGVLYYICLAN